MVKKMKKLFVIVMVLTLAISSISTFAFATEGSEGTYPIDKTATELDENDQTDVTLSVQGTAEGDIDVVLILGGSMQANKETVQSAVNLFKPIMENGKSKVKLGLLSLERAQEVIVDLNSEEAVLDADTYDEFIASKFDYISSLPLGTTNLHSQLKIAKAMLDADTDVDAANKYMFVLATGRTYWFDDENGEQATIVNKVNNTYYYADYLWRSQRGRNTSLYMLPDRYNNSYEAFLSDVETWVAADGDKYVFTPHFDTNDLSAYETWHYNNNKDLRALGIAGSRFGLGIVNPVPTAENFKNGEMNAIGSEAHPLHALNYERAQYESIQVYKELVAAGYNCYALCSESPNYQNGSEYITLGVKYEGTSTAQLGHSFMNYLATLGGQTEAPALWDYERDADGNLISTNVVLQEDFFESIEEDILYGIAKDSTVVDYIGKNDNGNFEFIEDAANLKLTVGNTEYVAEQTFVNTTDEKGAEGTEDTIFSSYAFTAPGAEEATFWLDYYYGDGETTERFVWTFGEKISVVSLTYKLQLTEKQEAAGEYIVPTNNSATLYPVDSDDEPGTPQDFPIPEVTYTVEPETPVEPEVPTEPETPTEPEVPTEPETPTEPEVPTEPEAPVEPETPEQELPEDDNIIEEPEESAPQEPVVPETPEQELPEDNNIIEEPEEPAVDESEKELPDDNYIIDEPVKEKAPDTGDQTSISGLLIAMLAAVGTLFVLRRKEN